MRKTLFCVLMMTLLLTACGAGGSAEESPEALAAEIRGEYLNLKAWSSQLEFHADYGERVYDFTVDASWRKDGETVLTIIEPELIAGITARLSQDGVYLEYDGASLSTGPITATGMNPLDAVPWLMEQMSEGFMAQCTFETAEDETQMLKVLFRDPEGTEGMGTEGALYFDPETRVPLYTEVYEDGFTVLTVRFQNFTKEMTTDDEPADSADLG